MSTVRKFLLKILPIIIIAALTPTDDVCAEVLLLSHFNDSLKAQHSAKGEIAPLFKVKQGSVGNGAGYSYEDSMPAIGGLDLNEGGSVCYPSEGNIRPDEGTFAFWFRLKTGFKAGPVTQRLFNTCNGPNKNDTWKSTIIMSWGGWNNAVSCALIGPDGKGKSVKYDTSFWQPGTRWHRIAFSWSKKNKRISLYIDGRLADRENDVTNFPEKLPPYIVIGARNRWHEFAPHYYDELIILDGEIDELEAAADFCRTREYKAYYTFSALRSISPISMGDAASTPFNDEVAADRKGGWTDQGPQTDRHDMPRGKVTILGIPFIITNGCIVLANSEREYFDKERSFNVGGKWDGLMFAQCGAWVMNPDKVCGYYDINYDDGSNISVPLITRKNIGDWALTDDLEKARSVLHGTGGFRKESGAYLYFWKNPEPAKAIKSITFRSTVDESIPILIAVSGLKANSGLSSVLEHLTMVQKDKLGRFNELAKTYAENVAKVPQYRKSLADFKPSEKQRSSFYGRKALRLIDEGGIYLKEISAYEDSLNNAIKEHDFSAAMDIEKHIAYLGFLPAIIENIEKSLKKADSAEIMKPLEAESLPVIDSQAPDSMRSEIVLNGSWEIIEKADLDELEGTWKPAIVPNTISVKAKNARLRRMVAIPNNWSDKKLRLHFEASAFITEVFVNRVYVGRHIGIDPFDIDITDKAIPGRENEIMVLVTGKAAHYNKERNGHSYPSGNKWDFGILQDVTLQSMPKVSVDYPYAWIDKNDKLHFWGDITGAANTDDYSLTVAFENPERNESFGPFDLTVDENGGFKVSADWKNPLLWGIGGKWGKPNLFKVTFELKKDGEVVDSHAFRTGFSRFGIYKKIYFALNGQPIFLQGDHYWVSEGHESATSRGFMMRYLRILREANFNITRDHHIGYGNTYNAALEVADELGFMLEPEAISGGTPKLMKSRNYSDPVYRHNLTKYHKGMARKLRTHPSVVLFSGSNEIFQGMEPLMDQSALVYAELEKSFNEVAPHILITQQGSNWRKEFKTVDVHYSMGKAFENWNKLGDRPLIHGEYNYMNGFYFDMQHSDPDKAMKAMHSTAKAYRERLAYEKANGVAGTMPFPASYMMSFCTASKDLMGPFADLITPDKLRTSKSWYLPHMADIKVSPVWPSVSGRGRRVQRIRAGSQAENINFWDPTRKEFTPNEVYDAFRDTFYKMPPLKPKMSPEVIVTGDTKSAKLPIWMEGTSLSCPRAVMPDTAGKAWFHPPAAGEYVFRQNNKSISINASDFDLQQKPGYNYIQQVKINP